MSMSIKSVNFTPRRASIIYELQNSAAVLKKETSFSKNAVPAQKTAMRSTASFCDIDYLNLVNYNITTTQRFFQYLFNIYQKKINGKTGLQKVGVSKTRDAHARSYSVNNYGVQYQTEKPPLGGQIKGRSTS